MPALAARRLHLELFYEVKANLKKAQVRLLRDAGVRVIQPGIESFSTRVLDIMRRGFHFSAESVGLDARFRLSRFAYCRRVGQTLIIESPLSAARTILPDGTGAALLAELATPRTCRDLCARTHTTNRAELHANRNFHFSQAC